MDNEKILEVAISAAMRAGTCLMDNYRQIIPVVNKESPRDVATPIDRAAERVVFAVLRAFNPDIPVLSEEHGFQGRADGRGCWVVDALDGTVNYLHQVPFFSVSIAFVLEGVTQVGVVYAPLVDDIYYGARGIGVFKNQRKIVTPDPLPRDSLFAATFSGKSYEPHHRQEEFSVFSAVNDQSRGCLRTGSAALNLAYLAEGRFNGCWGKANKAWDIRAGLLLAELAGAAVLAVNRDTHRHLMHYLAAPAQNFVWLKSQLNSLFTVDLQADSEERKAEP
jgi:myo-inositol-1(or 4)-monophosphatase